MSGVGFMNNYIHSNSRLYSGVERRREHLRSMKQFEVGRDHIEDILDDIAELKLVVATLARMLVEKSVLVEKELLDQAKEIDILDGKLDGKLRGTVEPDGSVKPEPPPMRSDLDDLADATQSP